MITNVLPPFYGSQCMYKQRCDIGYSKDTHSLKTDDLFHSSFFELEHFGIKF